MSRNFTSEADHDQLGHGTHTAATILGRDVQGTRRVGFFSRASPGSFDAPRRSEQGRRLLPSSPGAAMDPPGGGPPLPRALRRRLRVGYRERPLASGALLVEVRDLDGARGAIANLRLSRAVRGPAQRLDRSEVGSGHAAHSCGCRESPRHRPEVAIEGSPGGRWSSPPRASCGVSASGSRAGIFREHRPPGRAGGGILLGRRSGGEMVR